MRKSKLLLFSIPLIVVLFAAVIYRYGYQEVSAEVSSIKEAESAKTKTLAKYMSLLAEKPDMEKRLAALKEEGKALNSLLIEGQTPSIAAASLQETVKGIIVARGGNISSERAGKPETLGRFMVITVSMDINIPDVRALADVLYAIETRTPYFIVKELDVRVKNFKEPKELSAKLDIAALTNGK
ncbi:MAG: hypothetical protein HQL08_09845 [Nitrospirae bacterium]|nr:hypothetical protein [Nitrospirota bacterium]